MPPEMCSGHPLLEPVCLLSFKHNSWKVTIVLLPELRAFSLRTVLYCELLFHIQWDLISCINAKGAHAFSQESI